MFTKIFVGITMVLCIGCFGAGNHDTYNIMITKNTEKFIKFFDLSPDRESVEPFKITPLQILQNPLFDKFELGGYSCEVNKRDGAVSEISVFKQNERTANIQLMTANTNRASIITLVDWITFSSMPIDILLDQYAMEKNGIGEICFFNRKTYNKSTKRFSRPNGRFFFIRHGIIVLLRNTTETCPVGEIAKAIDNKILKVLADIDAKNNQEN